MIATMRGMTMKCELCHEADAQTVLFKDVEGKKKELYVCHGCAEIEKKQSAPAKPDSTAPQGEGVKPMPPEAVEKLNALMNVIVNAAVELKGLPMKPQSGNQEACPRCGITRDECRKEEELGCPACYQAFTRYLEPVIKDLHKAGGHVGRAPAKEEIKFRKRILQARLKEAIARQEYDQAARILREIDALMLAPTPPPPPAPTNDERADGKDAAHGED